MTTQQMEYLEEIVRCGSFSAAEDNLYVSRQVLMRQINRLEQELGFAIFDRNHQGIVLTEAGVHFVRNMQNIRGQIHTLTQECRNIDSHAMELRIELPNHPNSFLDEVIEQYHQMYPNIQISIVMKNSKDRGLRLRQGKMDVAEYPKTDRLEEGLEYTPLISSSYYCLMSKDHPLAGQDEIAAPDLAGYRLYTSRLDVRQDLVRFLLEQHCDRELIAVEDEEVNQIRNICYNQGIFLTPAYYARKMDQMKAIPLKDSSKKEIGLLTQVNPPEKVRNFVKLAQHFFLQEM